MKRSILLLLGISFQLFACQSEQSAQLKKLKMSTQLDTQHYRQSQGNSPFLEGDLLYEKGDFKMALHAYENLDAGNFAFDKKLRVALCHWQLGNHAEALKLLESLYQPKDNLRYLEAAWFLALIRLETGEKTAAKLYLEEVRDLQGKYASQAKELLLNL